MKMMPALTSETTGLGFQRWQPSLTGQPELLTAEVTFFKQSGMPTYYAIVGEAPPEDVETLIRDFPKQS